MPKPTNLDTYQARRDGKFERKGTWSEVTVGSVIFGPQAGQHRYDLWEVVDTAAGAEPAGDGMTLWIRLQSIADPTQYLTIPPQKGTHGVTFVCDSADDPAPLPPPSTVADKAALDLLVEGLGATILHTRDNATGEILCPNYDIGDYAGAATDQWYGAEEIEHMRRYHGIDATGMDMKTQIATHSAAHTPGTVYSRASPVPHRHPARPLTAKLDT